MSMNKLERRMLDQHLTALRAVRAYLEPHPSWESDTRRATALHFLYSAIGASDSALIAWYAEQCGWDKDPATPHKLP